MSVDYQKYQSAFGNAGVGNHQFLVLFAIFIAVCAIMYILVIAFLVAGLLRRGRAGEANVVESGRHHRSSPLMRTGLIAWGAIVAVGLVTLAIASFVTDRLDAQAAAHEKLSITVTGNQWWWDVQYNSADASKVVRTANEIHVLVHTRVAIVTHTADVIHSFWIPQLSGKTDAVPGQHNRMWLTAGLPGSYLGQCAEFCGTEHALMQIKVVVDSQNDFAAWVTNQQKPAASPQTADEQAGFQIVQGACAGCHSLDPAQAEPKTGPNLAHLLSRSVFAGAHVDLTDENLRRWLKDTQSMKPGNDMQITLKPEELDQVLAYLKLLK